MTLLRRALTNLAIQRASPLERLPVSPSATLASGGLAGTLLGMGQTQPMQAYGSVGWLFAVVSRIAEATAAAVWRLGEVTADGEFSERPGHPLAQLWAKPNPFYIRAEFVETIQQHFELVGEAWFVILRAGRTPAELWPVRPDRIRPIPSRESFIAGYEYRLGAEVIPLATEDVVSIIRPNPLDMYRGLGVVQTIIADLEGERMAALWNRNFFRNSAEPGGIIQLDQRLSDAEFEQFVSRWRQQHQGVANAHRVAVLEQGTWVDRKFTQRDMQFEQLRRASRDTIIGAFGMPRHLLGITEDINRANAEAAEVMFARWIVRPRLERLRGALNAQLAPLFGPNLQFDYVDPAPEDRELRLREAEVGAKTGTLTVNEIRRRLGEDVIDGGDGLVMPPVNMALPAPERTVGAGATGRALVAPSKGVAPSLDELEAEMRLGWERRLARELKFLLAYLGELGKAKSRRTKIGPADVDSYNWDWWARYGDEVMAELERGFALAYAQAVPDLAPGPAQRLAVQYAATRSSDLLQIDGDVSVVATTRERVRSLVAGAIERGESLQTLQKSLREDFAFSRSRAESIARTETATALGRGTLDAAVADGREEKRWITQADELVDEGQCVPNAAAGWIGIAELFPSGHDTVPAHPRCRCSLVTRHKPLAGRSLPDAGEVHCPECNGLLGKGVTGAQLYCRRCKREVGVGDYEGGIEARCPNCQRLLAKSVIRAELYCPRCKTVALFTEAGGEVISAPPGIKAKAKSVPPITTLLLKDYSESEVVQLMEERWEQFTQQKAQRRAEVAVGIRFKVFQRDGFRCRYCGRAAAEGAVLEVDHIVPRSKGGEDTLENLCAACWECNRGKGAGSVSVWNPASR